MPGPADLLLGATTFLWYATPDLLPDRRARTVVKAGLLAGGAAIVARAMREEGPTPEPAEHAGAEDLDPRVVAAAGAAAVAALAVSALAERGIHRGAQALGRAGLPAPHVAVGLLLGVATTAMRPLSRD